MFSWGDFARQAQERRIAQLSDDNAFVDVKAVLSSSSAATSAATAKDAENALNDGANKVSHRNRDEEAMDLERRFFESESTGGSASLTNTTDNTASCSLRVDRLRGGEFGANGRLNLTQCFIQQHKDYTEALARAWKEANENDTASADEDYEGENFHTKEASHDSKVSETHEEEIKAVGRRQVKHMRTSKKMNNKKRQQTHPHATPTKGQPQRRYLKQSEVRLWCPTKAEDVETELSEEVRLLHAWYTEMNQLGNSKDDSEDEYDTASDNVADTSKNDGQPAKRPKTHGTGSREDKARKGKGEYEQPHSVAPSVLRFLTGCPSYTAMTSPSPLSMSSSESKGWVKEVPGCHTHHLCSVCLLPAVYRCARCRSALFCSIKCHVAHEATRCMKYTV
ncbi:unnamed protein product [Phytomonas sp. EM1]|nr:unnamed protein product [Phytomonas sp. EM1]|eukprot:CCW63512.1 unnamed protein product [Phytomonas sp. isolate EM1]